MPDTVEIAVNQDKQDSLENRGAQKVNKFSL